MWRFWILRAKRRKAFLLVEVLLTIVILSIGLTILLRSILQSLQAGKIAADYLQAQLLLEDNLTRWESQGEIEDGLQLEETLASPNEKFKLKLNTENIKTDDKESQLNKVVAIISWVGQKKNHNLSLFTYLKNKKNEE